MRRFLVCLLLCVAASVPAAAAAVVLAHQGGGSLCGWVSYAKTLVRAGLRVVAFDFRGYGTSERPEKRSLLLGSDLAAAVAHARASGATHVFLLGASMGGAAVVQNTAWLHVAAGSAF